MNTPREDGALEWDRGEKEWAQEEEEGEREKLTTMLNYLMETNKRLLSKPND